MKSRIIIFVSVAVLAAAAAYLGYIMFLQAPRNIAMCEEQPFEDEELIAIDATEDGFEPTEATASQCDVLWVENMSDEDIELVFGPHEDHIDYPDYTEQVTSPGDFIEVELSQAGEFHIHNHRQPEHSSTVTVEKDPELTQQTREEVEAEYDTAPEDHDNAEEGSQD